MMDDVNIGVTAEIDMPDSMGAGNFKSFQAPVPPGVRATNIGLNPNTPIALRGTFQERIYLRELEEHGQPLTYKLQQNIETGEYFLRDIYNRIHQIKLGQDLRSVYSFVILEVNGDLELKLGKNQHYFISNRASSVKAAGDIYFVRGKNGYIDIDKITDQSGAYNVINE